MNLKKLLSNRIVKVAFIFLIQIGWFLLYIFKLSEQFWWIHLLMQVLSLMALLIIVNKNENPAYKLAWAIPILAFPVFGGLLYLFFGGKKPARKLRRQLDASANRIHSKEWQKQEVLDKIKEMDRQVFGQVQYLFNSALAPIYQNTQTTYYVSGEDNFPDLLKALEEAKHFIFIEYFIIAPGKMWDSILEIMKKKAADGVDVRLIYDDFGCMALLPHHYKEELAKYKIKCEVFNPVRPFFSSVLNHRDHRKILVVDGYIGFTGGLNLADEYINEKERFGYWKDTGIRLIGEGVLNLTAMFLTTWNALSGEKEDIAQFLPTTYHESIKSEDGFVQPYGDSPLDSETVGENVYLNIINSSKDYVYLFTPYLIIDHEMTEALCNAAKRGIDVRIITPGIPDKKLVFCVTQSYYTRLVESGVSIYEFTPGFVHAKCFVCDDHIATVGTINMDYRSLYLHFECGVYLYHTSTVMDVKKDFLTTQEKCTKITHERLNRHVLVSLMQAILRLFSPLM